MGKFASDKPTLEEIRRLKKPNRQTVEILLDPEMADDIKRLEKDLRDARRLDARENRNPQAPGIEKQLETLQEEALEYTAEFVFQDIGRKRFEDLIKAYPPSEEEKEAGNQWDPEAFAPALVAATAFQPEMTIEEASDLLNEWGHGEAEALFTAALLVCTERAPVPFTRASTGTTPTPDLSSTTALSGESPTDGS